MTKLLNEWSGEEIRAYGEDSLFLRRPITVDVSQGPLVPGTIMGKVTATGRFVAYSDVAANGAEVARGVLMHHIDPATAGEHLQATMFASGNFVEAKLTGLDTAAKADLNGTSYDDGVFRFGF